MKEIIVLGVTLIFKQNEQQSISGVLKSIVLKTRKNEIESTISHLGKKISEFYNYSYIGIYDVFLVSGELKEGEILGRTTYYEYDSLKSAKSLVSNSFSINSSSKSDKVNCSLIFFCENYGGDKFAMSIITIINTDKPFIEKVKNIAISDSFIKKIKSNSIEKIKSLSYLGINDIGEVDLEFNTFQTFYANFNSLGSLKNEIISQRDMKSKLKDILISFDNIVY